MNKKASNNNTLFMSNLVELVPSTRYQGSKRRILDWIYINLKDLKFKTVLDGFGGTTSVSYLFKLMKKKVTFNDILLSNYQSGIALIENSSIKLDQSDIQFLTHKNGFEYPTFIQDTFKGIYYLDIENKWLDMVLLNIENLSKKYEGEILKRKRALAFHILFQACLCKRPFNLFHRKNLYLRKANINRSFGNKTTWDTDFRTLFLRFSNEVSQKIFSNNLNNKAVCEDIMKFKNLNFDLVYLDPPYAKHNEKHPKKYHSMYHFLEGAVNYQNWFKNIDWKTKNRRLIRQKNEWNKNSLEKNFDLIFKKFKDSIIVISYGSPGTPSIRKIKEILQQYKSKIDIIRRAYKYMLNHNNRHGMEEVLIIGQ